MKDKYMKMALEEAKKAYLLGEVPIGAVIVKNDEVISKAYNMREKSQMATAHAEVLAIEEACRKLGTWRLDGCDLYVTVLPCAMCAGAIINSRVSKVVYGALEEKFGYLDIINDILNSDKFNHKVMVEGGVMEEKCSLLMKQFFQNLRNKNN
ncbi:nucleoside deaminase [Mycoplasmatota bacterium]|nr:nucleoside deaminase [Mycoplasmatota bacterium]